MQDLAGDQDRDISCKIHECEKMTALKHGALDKRRGKCRAWLHAPWIASGKDMKLRKSLKLGNSNNNRLSNSAKLDVDFFCEDIKSI